MSLKEFSSKYHSYVKGIKKHLIDYHKDDKRVIILSPNYSSNPENINFPLYCYYYLMKHKPWINFPKTIHKGEKK